MSLTEAIDTLRMLDPNAADVAQEELDEIVQERDDWESDYDEIVKERDELEEEKEKLSDTLYTIQELANEAI